MGIFQNLSIKNKLRWIITLTSSIALLLACTAFLAYDQFSSRRMMVRDLTAQAELIGANCSAALLFDDAEAAGEIVGTVSANPHVISAFLYSHHGEVLTGFHREDVDIDPPTMEGDGYRFDGEDLALFREILLDDERIGTIYLRSDLQALHSRLQRYGTSAAVVLLGAVLVVFGISSRLQRVISVPILTLANASRRIGVEKDYSIRVQKQSSDEVGLLTDAFNEMVTEIQLQQGALKKAHHQVETLLEERTKEAKEEASGRREAEEALRESEEQLRQSQKMEAIGLLAGGIAHDFNNLLTVIAGYSELMLERLDRQDPLWKSVDAIKEASDRASSLTGQLLAFSRKQVLAPKILQLNSILGNMRDLLRRVIGEDVELERVTCPTLGRVKADPGQMEQVLVNLAVNARDAMSGGGELTIETSNVEIDVDSTARHSSMPPGRYVVLAMSDTGCGMDEATKARIFEPFYTTKEKGKGTGLGLSTVYGIVKQSGGWIFVESEPGRGTTFRIYLPRVDDPADTTDVPREVAKASAGSETVLLVEDEDGVRELARSVLEMSGYKVLEAPHGGEAVLICERHSGPIHLMLTDVVMPRMNGREVYERVAGLRPDMRVLYMSGYTDEAIVHHGVLEEGTAFLAKPFTPNGLTTKVREVLDGLG